MYTFSVFYNEGEYKHKIGPQPLLQLLCRSHTHGAERGGSGQHETRSMHCEEAEVGIHEELQYDSQPSECS